MRSRGACKVHLITIDFVPPILGTRPMDLLHFNGYLLPTDRSLGRNPKETLELVFLEPIELSVGYNVDPPIKVLLNHRNLGSFDGSRSTLET